jgi:hypothetical protein
MRSFFKGIINYLSFRLLLWILILLSGQNSWAQDTEIWNKTALRDSVSVLLGKYKTLHNQLSGQTDPNAERAFVRLFSNPKVQIISSLNGKSESEKISVDEYIIKLAELFPDGLIMDLDPARLSMGQPKYDRNGRYLIRVRIGRSLNGISKGKVFSTGQRIIVLIAFRYVNNLPGGYTIYGIDLPQKGESYLTGSFSPGVTGFLNSNLKSDARLALGKSTGYAGNVRYSFFFTDHVGISTGAQFSQYCGRVTLAQFDFLGDYAPNMKDIVIDNDLRYLEIPLLLSYRAHLPKPWEITAELGLVAGYRIFENMTSSAVNVNTGMSLVNVISDVDWISRLNRLNFGIQGSAGMKYWLTRRIGFVLGAGIRQGLSSLVSQTENDFAGTKYLGHYNPLWSAPGRTLNQAIFVNVGLTVFLNRELN